VRLVGIHSGMRRFVTMHAFSTLIVLNPFPTSLMLLRDVIEFYEKTDALILLKAYDMQFASR